MTVEQANALMGRVSRDAAFRERLERAPQDRKRAILVEEGYGDVRLSHISAALPEAAGGELTDDEFASISGGGDHDKAIEAGIGVGVSVFTAGVVAAAFA